MNKLSQTSKLIILGVVAIALMALIAVYGRNTTNEQGENYDTTPSGNTTRNTPGGGTTGGSTAGTGTGGTTAKAPIVFVTPVPGVTWKIATPNQISWSREASVTGQIALLDASTLKLVGVILNQIGPHQTSYTWNTRDLYLSRTDPRKTTVLPGRYVIKISFDGNNLSPITSQPVNLVQ